MGEKIIHTTGRMDDSQVVKFIRDVIACIGPVTAKLQFAGVSITVEQLFSLSQTRNKFSISLCEIKSNDGNVKVSYCRGVTAESEGGEINTRKRISSPYYDEVIVEYDANDFGLSFDKNSIFKNAVNLEETIQKHIINIRIPNIGKGVEGAVDILRGELAQLTSFHAKMLDDANSLRLQAEEDRRRLQNEFDNEVKKIRDEHSRKVLEDEESIKERILEIDRIKKNLDDRNHMHVRRALRESITAQIESQVNSSLLPKRESGFNLVICIFSFLCSFFAIYISYASFVAFQGLVDSKNADANYLMILELVRGAVASIGAIGLLLYSIGWMRRTYLSNVKAAQDLQKYALDLNRASWVIETIMEMTTKEGRVLPEKWIEGACHGLFQASEQGQSEITPMEAWTALLASSAHVQHGPNGTTLELSGKDAKKVAKG